MVGRIAQLWRYPAKSMPGERVNGSEVDERGLAGEDVVLRVIASP
jgi:uncharacterized protein YcbX